LNGEKNLNKMKKLLALIALFLIPFLTTKTSKKSYTYNPSLDYYIKLSRNQPKVEQKEILAEIAKEWGDLGYDTVIMAYRVVKCESNFDPYAISKTQDYGVFMINQVWLKYFNLIPEQLLDYKTNIKIGKLIYLRSGSFNPWVCFTKYL